MGSNRIISVPGERDCQHRVDKTKTNTICGAHHNKQTHTNNVNRTCALLETTESKDEPNNVSMQTSQHGTQNVNTHNRTTQKAKKMNNTNSTKKPEVNAGAREGYTLMVGMIH